MCIRETSYLMNDPAAVYPEYYMLYLLRLFHHAADPIDKDTVLTPKINELEKTLGLKKDEAPVLSEGLNDLFSAASDIAKELGINIPKGQGATSGAEFSKALSSLKDPKVKEQFKEMFSGVDLKDPRSLQGMFSKLMSKMNETASEVPEAVQRSLDATASETDVPAASSH